MLPFPPILAVFLGLAWEVLTKGLICLAPIKKRKKENRFDMSRMRMALLELGALASSASLSVIAKHCKKKAECLFVPFPKEEVCFTFTYLLQHFSS